MTFDSGHHRYPWEAAGPPLILAKELSLLKEFAKLWAAVWEVSKGQCPFAADWISVLFALEHALY